MSKIVRAMVATVAATVMAPVVAYSEPMVLTATQMESITAAAGSPISISVVVNTAIITQINTAIALSFAIGPGASASNFVAQSNAATIAQLVRR